jgi:outer membrane receptor protein involved in Fe transport
MRDKPYLEHKVALTPAEKLRVAVAVLVDGFDQHRVAALMGVNPGRINEAVVAVRQAIDPENNEAVELK